MCACYSSKVCEFEKLLELSAVEKSGFFKARFEHLKVETIIFHAGSPQCYICATEICMYIFRRLSVLG